MPKLSFVLPTHNRIEWMPECLQSLLEQTEKDIEIVVVNDASTDGTKEFLDAFASHDARIKVIHNETQKGGGMSRNIGADVATSEIIAVCDDDDVYPNDRAEATLRWFTEHPESEMVNFPYVRIGYFREILETFWGAEFDADAFKKDGIVSYFCNPSAAYKKAAANEIGGYCPEKEGMTDDIQFVKNWVAAGKKIDFDKRIFGVMHRVLPESMMAKQRGFRPEWVGSR
jgi:glycosyltransferase involved in cell wall biosynthesis